MTNRILSIAINTYREAIRQKVLYVLVVFTLFLILASAFLGQLTLGADAKMIKDMGLAAMMTLGAFMSVFLGIGLIFKEIERKTIYTILSKPVSRAEFVVGKFVGLLMVVFIELILMFVFLCLLLVLTTGQIDFNLTKAVVLIFMELSVLIAITLVFSSYSSSLMSTIFCFSFLLLGHLTDDFADIMLPRAAQMIASGQATDVFVGRTIDMFVRGLEIISLDHFAINTKIVHGVPIGWDYVFRGIVYGFCLQGIFLLIAIKLFSKKDLQ
ncbi:MAG: ABC transporter permease subunit [Bdellovibrionales bacterium]|nr:ABC transporter permease subunit [Bdellovibrionales bacterium]